MTDLRPVNKMRECAWLQINYGDAPAEICEDMQAGFQLKKIIPTRSLFSVVEAVPNTGS